MKTYKDYENEYNNETKNRNDLVVKKDIWIFAKWSKDNNINDNKTFEIELKKLYVNDKQLCETILNAINEIKK